MNNMTDSFKSIYLHYLADQSVCDIVGILEDCISDDPIFWDYLEEHKIK